MDCIRNKNYYFENSCDRHKAAIDIELPNATLVSRPLLGARQWAESFIGWKQSCLSATMHSDIRVASC